MPGFPRVLQRVAEAYRRAPRTSSAAERPPSWREHVAAVLELPAPATRRRSTPTSLDARCAGAASAASTATTAASAARPSSRTPMDLRASCCAQSRAHRRRRDALAHGRATRCDKMARGGIYDQLGGGFHRYSRRRALAGAALREDALRQRAARRASTCTPTRLTGDAALPRGRRGDARLRPARDDRSPTAASTPPRTPTARARRASSTSGRPTRSRDVLGDEDAAVCRRATGA